MRNNDWRSWFRPKRVGWGYSPATWQGYAVVFAVVVLVMLTALLAAWINVTWFNGA